MSTFLAEEFIKEAGDWDTRLSEIESFLDDWRITQVVKEEQPWPDDPKWMIWFKDGSSI